MKSLAKALHLEQLEARILLDGFVDLFEPNDDFAGAADLGPVVGAELVGGLTLHNDTDEDFFAFTTVAAATESHYVLMDVPAGAETILELYDAGESLLAWGTYVDGGDLMVSLAELPAGTYYIRADGWMDPLQSYQLQIFAPGGAEGDIYEPNDSFGEATTLAEVSAEQLWADLTIHSDTDVDYFQFTLLAEGAASHYAQIQFTHADGDLDLALYDVAEDYLTSSKTITDNELISLEGMAAGTYYLRVYGYEGATNDYDLLIIAPTAADVDSYEPNDSFVAATDFGQQNGPLQIYDLTIHGGDEDYFTFTTQEDFTASSYAEIRFGHAEGDLDLELFDSGENLVLSSTTATDNETIWLSGLSPGKYYIHVTGYNGATNGYELRLVVPRYDLEADAYESNESFGTARDLGQVTGTNEWTDLTIHSEDDEDWFKFTTLGTATGSHSVQLRFSHADGNIEISVYDSEQRLKGWGTTPTDDEWVSLAGQPAGTYYIVVYGRWTAVNAYDLVISAPLEEWPADAYEANDSFATASDLGEVGAWTEIEELTVHSNTDVDYFRFTTRGPGTEANYIEVAFTHADGDLDLALYGGAMNFLVGSTSVTDDERVSLDGLPAGTYYAKVSGYAGATNEYELRMAGPLLVWDADPYEPNDELAAATDLRGASGTQRWNDLTIHDTEDEDYFQFTTYDLATWTHSVTIEFSHAEGNLTLRLYDQDGYSLRTGSSYTDNESVTLGNLPPGTYYVSVGGGGYATNGYDLVIVAPAQVLADPYESNDDFVTATNLREISGTQELTGLSIHSQTDEDYFLFSTTGTQTTSHYVEISLNNDDGDLDLVIYDASWAPVAWSTTTRDVERVSLGGLPADTYYAHVVGYEDGINSYDLVICAPAAAIPPDGWEDSEPVPIRSNGTIEGLTIHDPADWDDYGDATDRFEFTMATTGGPAHHVSINFAHADGDLDMRLWNSSWSIVGASASVTNDEFISLYGLPADTYTAEIYSYDGKETAYDFSINAPLSSTGPPVAWTFLYYFGGDDISGGGSWSLETYAWEDVNDMERVNLPWDLQVGILMDRIEGYVTTDPDWTDTRVGILRHDSNTWTVSTEFDQWEPEERNIGLAYTLESFINWASVALPAQHYGLFLMDHGFGYRGVCWDETSADDQLTLAEIQQALAGAAVDIDVIGFDACLMGIADVAYALQDYVDVVVGSEEVEWAPGWDNQRLLNALAADWYLTPEDVGSYIVQAYASYWGNEDMGTLSAIDCSVDWAGSVADFVDAVLTYATPADWQLMAWARSATPTFRHAYFYDLRTFMSLIWVTSANSPIKNAAWGAMLALNSAVIENYSAEGEGGTGLSVYIPPMGEEVDPFYRYQDFAQDTGWVDFLDAFVAAGAVPGPTPDWAESNDVFALAYDLHSLHGEGWFFPNLSIHGTYNDDWFRLTTLSEGTSDHQVLIDFDNSEGNIDLHLYDGAGYLLRTSEGDTDFEMVTLNLLAADTYYIRVFGRGADVNPDYTLHVDAPPSVVEGFDWPVGNINLQKAMRIQGEGIYYAGLFVGEGEEDWFGLDGSMLGWQTTLTIQAIYDPVAYDLTLTMCDPDGQPLATSVENADGCVVVLHGAESGSFYLQVTSGTPGLYVPYTLVVDESLDPYIELEDPAAGTLQRPGDTYTINWTDQHPDGDAVIALYWDSDSDPDNNDPGDAGVTWGTIATDISENDTANALDWTVNAPSGADYYLHAVIAAGDGVNSDYTGTTLGVWECHLIASDVVDGVTVSVYDADPSNDISHPSVAFSRSDYVAGVTDVLVDAGRIGDGIIGAIILLGDGTETADLGIVVEDNVGLGSLVDARTASRPIRFFVSEGYVGAVNLKDGIAGYDLNGFTTEGGWVLDPGSDIDRDGDNDDPTGVYVNGYLRSLVARGDVNGDVVVGGDLSVLQVLGGDLNGDVVLTASNLGTVLARSLYGAGGSIGGDIYASGNIGAVLAIGGDLTGDVEAESGYIGRVLAQALYDPHGSDWVGGSISGDITAGQWIGSVQAIRGSAGVDSTIQAGGWINLVQSVGGDIAGSITATSGHVGRVLAQAIWTGSGWQGGAIGADVTAGDYVASVVSVNGSGIAADVTAGSWVGSVVSVGGDVQGTVTASDGHVASVLARAAWNGLSWSGGSMDVDVSATGHVGSVISVNGAGMACDVTSGSWIGQVTSIGSDLDLTGRQITALDRIGLVRAINGSIVGDGDDATWEVEVTGGNVGAIQAVNGAIAGISVHVAGAEPYLGNIGSVVSRGAGAGITQSLLAAESRLTLVQAWGLWDPVERQYQGDLYNTSIRAGALGRILVGGHIYEDDADGDPDEIHAHTGRFFARDKTWAGWIPADHWFDEGEPDGVSAWVG